MNNMMITISVSPSLIMRHIKIQYFKITDLFLLYLIYLNLLNYIGL